MIWAIAILIALILTTYLVFPLFTILLAEFRKEREVVSNGASFKIYLLMAAHNEEQVIGAKLDSILQSNFNKEKLVCYIGSDASTDQTNVIIEKYSDRLNLHFISFDHRQGKPAIINQLVEKVKAENNLTENDLFLLTDANVTFHPDFISEMVTSFNDSKVGLVDGNIQNPATQSGIGTSESQYLQLETKIKQAEGKLWGCSMGPFGGAFMMRAQLFQPVPNNFLVDDFFIFYHVVKAGKQAIFNKNAICYEAVSGDLKEEFRRKVRISTGNFQNTAYFFPYLLKLWKTHNLVFILHKLLRWLSPVFALAILVIAAIGSVHNSIWRNFYVIMISLLVGIPVLNYLLNQLNLKLKWLQGLSYLIIMNIALFIGLIKFIKGVRTNVWEPTKRKI
ncbi:MAG: glycosyltransferase [Chitinophagales bacterium]